jgi:hypothetical protein
MKPDTVVELGGFIRYPEAMERANWLSENAKEPIAVIRCHPLPGWMVANEAAALDYIKRYPLAEIIYWTRIPEPPEFDPDQALRTIRQLQETSDYDSESSRNLKWWMKELDDFLGAGGRLPSDWIRYWRKDA